MLIAFNNIVIHNSIVISELGTFFKQKQTIHFIFSCVLIYNSVKLCNVFLWNFIRGFCNCQVKINSKYNKLSMVNWTYNFVYCSIWSCYFILKCYALYNRINLKTLWNFKCNWLLFCYNNWFNDLVKFILQDNICINL